MRLDLAKAMNAGKFAVVCSLISLAGCASMGPKTPEEQVKARAQERNDAIVKGDMKRVYSFFTPGYRGTVSADTYTHSMGNALRYVGSTVESVKCESLEKCVAKVKVEIKPLVVAHFKGTISSYEDETWLFEAGQWWFYQPL